MLPSSQRTYKLFHIFVEWDFMVAKPTPHSGRFTLSTNLIEMFVILSFKYPSGSQTKFYCVFESQGKMATTTNLFSRSLSRERTWQMKITLNTLMLQ